MKTNRILTAAWGALYLVTPIWTYFIMQTDAASLVGAINSVLPALMGVFTAWFQKWYPAHIARGGRNPLPSNNGDVKLLVGFVKRVVRIRSPSFC